MSDARTGVGERTKDKLESLGILSLADILNTSDETMLKAGIARKYITKLKSYATRRMN